MLQNFLKRIINRIIKVNDVPVKYDFPCKDCLIKAMCTQACDKIIMDDTLLMKEFVKHEACPDCGGKDFIEGPCGGMSQNIKCSGCGHWFNVALPVFIQRIRITDTGGFIS